MKYLNRRWARLQHVSNTVTHQGHIAQSALIIGVNIRANNISMMLMQGLAEHNLLSDAESAAISLLPFCRWWLAAEDAER